jgi:hypothetical protein
MEQIVQIFNNLPTQLRPLVAALFACMCAIAGLMVMTAGRNSNQVAGGLLTIRNAVLGGAIFVLAAAALVSFLGSSGINLG